MPLQDTRSPLLDRNLTTTAKVVWLALRRCGPASSPVELERRTGLSRPTVQQGLTQLQSRLPTSTELLFDFPDDLLSDKRVGAPAKVLYGILQVIRAGHFTYPKLSSDSGMASNTLKQAIKTLQEQGWIKVTPGRKFDPIRFTLHNPVAERRQAEAAQADERLKGPCRGEKLMREYLSLLIDCNEYEDNATPGFLINPLTGKELETVATTIGPIWRLSSRGASTSAPQSATQAEEPPAVSRRATSSSLRSARSRASGWCTFISTT
ncbi:MAG TPA: hypothetical protein VD969_23500 [Symbiobacteriaceae bacterium]|nr:hypothetical protein [Symbiobacteriaceae bacterium]